jgi:hypothetical protein
MKKVKSDILLKISRLFECVDELVAVFLVNGIFLRSLIYFFIAPYMPPLPIFCLKKR